jgi:hypothetical protein
MSADIIDSLIYLVRTNSAGQVAGVEQIGSTQELGAGYSSLAPVVLGGKTYLLAYDRSRAGLHVFQLLDSPPWVTKLPAEPNLGPGFDVLEPFTMGNLPYLMCYASKEGNFELHSIGEGFSLSKPYRYFRDREPGVTRGYTMVKPVVSRGRLGLMGYNFDDGHVAIYAVSVRTTSPSGVPPLSLSPVWSHYWSPGWTRFAFFQFGGESFFLKTNVLKHKVNIDHILDDFSGNNEVGAYLDLRRAEQLEAVSALDPPGAGPHFVTYEKNGEMTVNRIRSDCLGWSLVSSLTSKEGASHVVSFSVGDKSFLVLS